MQQAKFVVAPHVLFHFTPERDFIGPGVVQLRSGELYMVTTWMRPRDSGSGSRLIDESTPKQRATQFISADNGRTWRDAGPMAIESTLPGIFIEQTSLARLQDGRLMALFQRAPGQHHGGGMPAISFSSDEGKTWTAARLLAEREGEYYIMNNRIVQTRSGRILVPFSHVPDVMDVYEGRWSVAFCYASDDGGETWTPSEHWSTFTDMVKENKWDGMQEPAVAELNDGRLLMVCRTGRGRHYTCLSADGNRTWSNPEPTAMISPCAPLSLTRLPDGKLFIVYDHARPDNPGSLFPRNPLVYATSVDEGATWSEPVMIDNETNVDLMYAAITCTDEGIVLVYSGRLCPGYEMRFDDNYYNRYWQVGGAKSCILSYP